MKGIDGLENNYLAGDIYHMVHADNLRNILGCRALLSKEQIQMRKIQYHSIANDQVQSRRDRVFIRDSIESRYRSLHSYVPFYFNSLTPMLYRQYSDGIQEFVVFLVVSRLILREQGVLFTDGNAANQQLSDWKGETVYIVPAQSLQEKCRRRYDPSGPHGTNANKSDFYANIEALGKLRWDIIEKRWFNNDQEKVRIKHSEVLVPDIVPLKKLKQIVTCRPAMAQEVNRIIAASGLRGKLPAAISDPRLFF